MQIFNLRLTNCRTVTQTTTVTFRNRELTDAEPICKAWSCTDAPASFLIIILFKVAAELWQPEF